MKHYKVYLILFLLAFAICNIYCNSKDASNSQKDKINTEILVNASGKKSMILHTDKPINLETPLKCFLFDFTPNDVFFVRWHSQRMPQKVDEDTFHLRISGHVKNELSFTLKELKTKFKPHTVNALCLCVGNARSFCKPSVSGIQWANGGMGNAKWTGVKLMDLLKLATPKTNSKFISFNGLDAPVLNTIPDFVKSLPYNHPILNEVIVAYEMNGEPLPMLNGYPLKLVVPGWYATYWIGMLSDIQVHPDTFKTYWMQKAYLSPKGIENANEKPDSLAKELTPVTKIAIRSIFVAPEPNSIVKVGSKTEIQGLAFDGGDVITRVEISLDRGKTWQNARLDSSLGSYSWRRWRFDFTPSKAGKVTLMVKAHNAKGHTQPFNHWNRNGYMRNAIESLTLKIE